MYKTTRGVTACEEGFSTRCKIQLLNYAVFSSWKWPAGTSALPGFVGSLLTPVPQPSAYQELPARARFRHGDFGRN